MKRTFAIIVLLGLAPLCLGAETPFAWQDTKTHRPPSFNGYFPDDPKGGQRLDALWKAADKDSRSDREILDTVRAGLRRTKQHRTSILRWIGNRYIWGKSPQNPEAIELMYHAADFSGERADPYGTRHYAVYFGLSVVKHKTPPILRTLADLCMRVDDPNDLGRVAWGAKSQQDELLKCLQPYLTSDDQPTRDKARVLERIFKGELKAFQWAAEQAKKRAEDKYTEKLPEIKKTLEAGDSRERREVLQLIQRERITLIMDDTFVDAFAACAADPDTRVRNDVARIVGGRWIWRAGQQNDRAIDLMMRLSTDKNREVRYNAVYFGLSTVRQKDEKVVRRLLDMAFEDREWNLYSRITWGLQRDRATATRLLDASINGADTQASRHAREVYKDMTGNEPPPQEKPAPPPSDGKLRIGVYDSRAIVVAYVGSPSYLASDGKKLREMKAEYDKAKAEGDQKRMAELEKWGKSQQALMHKQAFSTAPVDDILKHIKDKIPDIAKAAGVGPIVSKWDKKALAKYKSAQQVDVTMALVKAFNPRERQLKSAIEIQDHPPISLEEAGKIDD